MTSNGCNYIGIIRILNWIKNNLIKILIYFKKVKSQRIKKGECPKFHSLNNCSIQVNTSLVCQYDYACLEEQKCV